MEKCGSMHTNSQGGTEPSFSETWDGASVYRLFERQVIRSPDATAVVCGNEILTYRDLYAQASRLAHRLQAAGLGPERLAGVCVERSASAVVALLAILKAGGAFVAMVSEWPKDRLAFIMEDAQVQVLVTQRSLLERMPSHAKTIALCLDDPSENNDECGNDPSPEVAPEHLAYVVYTSGSTGTPKGVMIEQDQIAKHCRRVIDYYGLSPADRMLHFASFGFDVAIENLFPYLAIGATVVLRGPELWDPETLTKNIHRYRLTIVNLTPAYWRQWLESLDLATVKEHLGSLRLVIVGGDTMPTAGVLQWRRLGLDRVRLLNMYGPTEATISATGFEVSPDWFLKGIGKLIPIGQPLPGRRAYVLGDDGSLLTTGQVGELCLGGEGIARGYLGHPELTASRFLADPFGNQLGERIYRTGDLARWRPDGTLECLGRMDHQVKIRGYRIELEEIEAVLGGHPALLACVVEARILDNDKELIAHVVAKNETLPPVEALRQWLEKRLPSYMVPSRFFSIPQLPLNSNGKLDRKALDETSGTELINTVSPEPPHNDREHDIAMIWQATLGRSQIGIHDDFYEIGGHSLQAIAISAALRHRFRLDIPLRLVLECPTVAQQAAALADIARKTAGITDAIRKIDREDPLPASFAQQGMWLAQQILPDAATYNEPLAWRLSGQADPGLARRILQVIFKRHDVLRTALNAGNNGVIQRIFAADTLALPWHETDLRDVPFDRQDQDLAECLKNEFRRPFDLAQAPLWRAFWIQLSETEQVFAFTFHHSIIDEWSVLLFLREWQLLFHANGQSHKAGLPELSVQYADYACWQRRQLAANLNPLRDYWQEQLRDLPPPLELPTDKTAPSIPSGQGAVIDFLLPETVAREFQRLARQERTTVFAVSLTAFQAWLYRCTGQKDMITGTPVVLREIPEVQSLMGLFLNTLPIRTRLDGTRTFLDHLRQIRQILFDAFAHAELPFEQMVAMATKDHSPGQHPLFRTMFVLLEEELPELFMGPVSCRRLPVETGTNKQDLILNIQATGNTWSCRLEYSADLFSAGQATRLVRHLSELFLSVAEDPGQKINRLRFVPYEELWTLLVKWNQTEREYPRDRSIHQMFEEQAARTPETIAAIFGEDSLTYGELNAQASRLASRLVSLGVGPGAIVGIHVERSLEMLVGILGILKAGGAYWGLEERLPAERFRHMLAEASPRLILVQAKNSAALSILASPVDGTKMISVVAIETLLTPEEPDPSPVVLPPSSGPDSPAYVSYTSGSTGRPKGVVVPHRGVMRLIKGADYFSCGTTDATLQLSPLSFDASTFELWAPLLNGGRVVLLPPGPPVPADIGEAIRRHGITILWLTAGLFHLMVEEAVDELRPLRQLLAGGDVLSPERVRRARQALPKCRISNGYGPTENTTFTCCYAIDEDPGERVPIGRPIANTRVYVLDAHQQPVPIGITGELYTGGDGLALGYLNQPEATAERFIPDPFATNPTARLYRTGDLARWRPDGILEFLGRLDSQVKIRGFRIELGEIETLLRRQFNIRDAVVVVREDVPGQKRLVAYLVAGEGGPVDQMALRASLAGQLPDYMIPAAFAWLDQIPLTANGKTDTRNLPIAELPTATTPSDYQAPTNLLELELLQIWRHLFRREDIGRQDNFFALGGHSLLAAQLTADISRNLGCKLPLSTLSQAPTVESLAQRLIEKDWGPAWGTLVPLKPNGSKPPLFFVHGYSGDVFCFVHLVHALPDDQPVYGIQAVGLDGQRPRHTRVEEMATHYAKEIVSFQPEGPLFLMGYSMGGLVAFETARQLQVAGRQVGMLAMLDSEPLCSIPWLYHGFALAGYLPSRCLFHLRRNQQQNSLGKNRDYWRGRMQAMRNLLTDFLTRKTAVVAPPKNHILTNVAMDKDYYFRIATAYKVPSYSGEIDVIVTDGPNSRWRWWYWKRYAKGGIFHHHLRKVEHLKIIEPEYAPVVAAALMKALQRVREKA